MKISFIFVLALSICLPSLAHRITIKQIKRPPVALQRRYPQSAKDSQVSVGSGASNNGSDLSSVQDLIYLANITVAGVEFPVQLDTGSSDLWVKPSTFPMKNTIVSTSKLNLSYAIGWAEGQVEFAPVEFVGLSVPSQAFLDVETAENPALGYGASGIAGLGFTSLSTIDATINATQKATGRSLLLNLFNVNKSEPNFIAFALERSTDPGDVIEGSFSIGEHDPQYASVIGNAPIPTWPVHSPKRWNVLLDALIVNTTITVPTSTVVNAPDNKAVALIDTGSSFTYAPTEICDAIYSGIPGAFFDASITRWNVPCSAEVSMALQIGGQVFPVHPLDVIPEAASGENECFGSFIPSAVDPQFDWLVGDNFLRSVYSVYDFGDFDSSGNMGDPYLKLLAILDPDQGSIDFHQVRGGTPRTNITYVGLQGSSIEPVFSISNDISDSLNTIGKLLPAVLGIVALNAVVLAVLLIVGLVVYCRKRGGSTIRPRTPMARTPLGRTSPMPPRNSYIAGILEEQSQPHIYEPVSMAMTEDTFVPPSPAFHKFDGTRLQPGDRPKSIA